MIHTNVLRLVGIEPIKGTKDYVKLLLQTVSLCGRRNLNPLTARHRVLASKLSGMLCFTELHLNGLTEEVVTAEGFGKGMFSVSAVQDEVGETPLYMYDLWVETVELDEPLNDNHESVTRKTVIGKDAKGNDKVEERTVYLVNRVVGLGEED